MIQPSGPSDPSDPVDQMLIELGQRVSALRKAAKLPRRVVSERSGVSPRYLAQIEAGQGNISIQLLARVADALDVPMLALLGADWSAAATEVARAFEAADTETRRDVMRRLADGTGQQRGQRVCLVGLRGAGKSTLGQRASKVFGAPFVELNREIEAACAIPVGEFIALYGHEGYRAQEAEALVRIADRYPRAIVAVAGGVFDNDDSAEVLRERFHTIWLKASPEEHMDRVRAQGDLRPMQGYPQAMLHLRGLLARRGDAYARANAQLDTSGQPVSASEAALVALIREQGFML